MSEWSTRSCRPDDVKDFIRRAHEWTGSPHEVVDIALLLNEAFVALRAVEDHSVICAVWQLRYGRVWSFAYRVTDENHRPRTVRCPERILALLSDPPPSDAARQWRAACWGRIITRRARPTLSDGDRIRLAQPARFADGVERDTFTAVRIGRCWRFDGDDGARCRFDVKDHDYEILQDGGVAGFDPSDGA